MYKLLSLMLLKENTLKSHYVYNRLWRIELMNKDKEITRAFESWKECYQHLRKVNKNERR